MTQRGNEITCIGNLTISIGDDEVHIRVVDEDASVEFLDIRIHPGKFLSALARLARVPCALTARGLDVVGKQLSMNDSALSSRTQASLATAEWLA